MTDRAACAGQDPKYWFPTTGELDEDGFEVESYDNEDADIGKAICNTCPIMLKCRKKHTLEPYGIFGGTTPIERGMVDGRKTRRATYART